MDTSSTARSGQNIQDDPTYSLEDWQDLKELFSKAVELYESQDPAETIPFLRGVIHECHRFMKAYQDPSSLFSAAPQPQKSSSYTTTTEERVIPEWPPNGTALNFKKDQTSPVMKTIIEPEKKCKCKDLPTAFHTIFGTTLFLFGNLIAQDDSLALQGEPGTPTPYWLAAIDLFYMGENLPIRTSGRGCPSAPQDWRMAVVWGRTLVNLADEILTRTQRPVTPVPTPMLHAPTFDPRYAFSSMFSPPTNSADDPKWPADSPFSLIAARRPPSSFRINMNTFTPHELLYLAQDQFSRGIFHMPHQKSPRMQSKNGSFSESPASTDPSKTALSLSLAGNSFSRARELYTIGSEVLLLAEKLDTPSERSHWAKWADGIFNQMRMENSTEDTWKVPLTIARGRSNLVAGSAIAEEMDNELERGDMQVLGTTDAEDARDALHKAITFLEKARELISPDTVDVLIPGPNDVANLPKTVDAPAESDADEDIQAVILDDPTGIVMSAEDVNDETPEQAELRTLLAEALLTLANLTADEVEREALYARAHNEGKGSFELEDDRMDESD